MLKTKFSNNQRIILKQNGSKDTDIDNFENTVYKMNKRNIIWFIIIGAIGIIFGVLIGKVL